MSLVRCTGWSSVGFRRAFHQNARVGAEHLVELSNRRLQNLVVLADECFRLGLELFEARQLSLVRFRRRAQDGA